MMEYRQLGRSGFKVPVLSLGTGTFGGGGELFKAWGASDVAEATRLVDICLEAGLTMFDSADIYSGGMAEEILGQAIKGRRDKVILSTKGTFRFGEGPNDVGSSRYHLKRSVEVPKGTVRTFVIGPGAVYDTFQSVTTNDIDAAEGACQHAMAEGPYRWAVWSACAEVSDAGGLRDVAAQRRARSEELRQPQ